MGQKPRMVAVSVSIQRSAEASAFLAFRSSALRFTCLVSLDKTLKFSL